MKSKTLVIFSVFACMLASCSKNELRPDIAEFILNFNVENAVANYKKVEMRKVTDINDNGEISKTVETITFDVNDVEAPQYRKEINEIKGEITTRTTLNYISYEEDKIYFVSNESKSEMTLEGAHAIVQTFFYTSTALDGQYHEGGYYNGDVIKNIAYNYQNFIRIDEENESLILEYSKVESGIKRSVKQIHDKWGMWKEYIASASRDNQSAVTTITVTKL